MPSRLLAFLRYPKGRSGVAQPVGKDQGSSKKPPRLQCAHLFL